MKHQRASSTKVPAIKVVADAQHVATANRDSPSTGGEPSAYASGHHLAAAADNNGTLLSRQE